MIRAFKVGKKIIRWFGWFSPISVLDDVRIDPTRRRMELGNLLYDKTNGFIKYGPFAQTRLPKSMSWNSADLGSIILGLYEEEVLHFVVSNLNSKSVFINIGAGDGYYLIGILNNFSIQSAVVFEANPESLKNIQQGVALNKITKSIDYYGMASQDFVQRIRATGLDDFNKAVILIDIEGNEYEILEKNNLIALKGALIVVELHEFSMEQKEAAQKLVASAKSCGYTISWI